MTTVAPDVPDILSAEHDRDPEIAYRYLREHAPAVFHPGSNSWLISRPEDILRLVRGKQVDSKNYEAGIGAVYGRNLLEMDGREHQQQRTLLNPLLHGVNLEGYQPLIRKVVDELLCEAKVNDAGLDEEVRAFISLMIVAGAETTERALGNVMLNLLQHPDQLSAVRQDRSLITDALVETLRFSPPVNVAGRTAAADIEIHGVTIPSGAAVTCLIGAANRDPRKFSDPDKFDIFRSDNSTQNGFTGRADHLGFPQRPPLLCRCGPGQARGRVRDQPDPGQDEGPAHRRWIRAEANRLVDTRSRQPPRRLHSGVTSGTTPGTARRGGNHPPSGR